jgi:hypothetical protein
MNPVTDGAIRSFRGLRTGDKKSLLSGVALLTYGLWKRNRGRKELIYRKTFKPGDAILIRANRAGRSRIVIDKELSEQNKLR